jgi:DDE superfamily endonuclease/Tc5 transposase DNA-binding domain/helix-turn-helix, Psq domain
MDTREFTIQEALHDIQTGVYSINGASKAYRVPRATLQTRLKGVSNRRISHEHRQRLTPPQEVFLVEWILEQDMQGYPPSHTRARDMATRILKMNGDTRPLGKRWLHNFMKRNTGVASVIGRRIESARVRETHPEQLQAFYTHFEATRDRLQVSQDNVWNVDEVGTALGVCMNSRVLANSSRKRTYISLPQNREWVSVLETVSATGRNIRPVIIFKGKQALQSSWFEEEVPDWIYTTSENGWTSNRIAYNWLLHVFIPETQPPADTPRLLVMDGHGSHIDTDFLWECKLHNIHPVFLPAHSSHILQPLDLSCFSILKRNYRKQIADLSHLDDAAPVKKRRFIECYNKARKVAFTDRNIRSGWKAAGVYPWNPEKGLSSSQVKTSSQQHPTTPPHPQLDDPLDTTPTRPHQVYLAVQDLNKRQGLSREERLFLGKAGKAIAMLNTEKAAAQATIQQQQTLIHELGFTGQKRKRVNHDPTTKFARIDNIVKAQREAAEKEAKLAARHLEELAKKAAAEMQVSDIQNFLFEWQLQL